MECFWRYLWSPGAPFWRAWGFWGAPGECFGAHLESESPKWRTRSEQWYSKRDYLVPVMRLWDTLGLHVEAAGGKKRAREAPEVHPAEIVKHRFSLVFLMFFEVRTSQRGSNWPSRGSHVTNLAMRCSRSNVACFTSLPEGLPLRPPSPSEVGRGRETGRGNDTE